MLNSVAIIGATGAVGTEFLNVLERKNIKIDQLFLVASSRSAGNEVQTYMGKLKVIDIEHFDFSKAQISFFSAGGSVSKKWAPIAANAGSIVIDNTSVFRMDNDKPLMCPEVNGTPTVAPIIANPNCSTIQIVKALAPIHNLFGLKKVVVSTYQSVSGAGNAGVDELHFQLLNDRSKSSIFSESIAHNVIPQIDRMLDSGSTFEEEKVRNESRKILGLPDLDVVCTAVRVPVFRGHSAAITVETEHPINTSLLYSTYKELNHLEVSSTTFHTPRGIYNPALTYISRIRQNPDNDKSLSLWVVADNLWVGAALNGVLIAEQILEGA
ncbi:aspartate-semialdehyde dehydrogenase [Aliivibrio fischeri]|uniref:aspartate-semialdehyde dehydrogenase n=1 Tax=Aliivibrio fischeri TaxID=668 RepID=UPI003735F318